MEAASNTNVQNPYEKVVKVCGLGLSELREQLADMLTATREESFQLTPTLAGVDILVSAPDALNKESRDRVKGVVRELKVRLGSYIYTTDPEMTLEEHVVALLKEQKMTMTTVESCTGGMVSAKITDVPGSSQVFKFGFVTYSNRAKRKLVNVRKKTLKSFTAVSAQTAEEMAKGGAEKSESDACLSVTGYAGPEAGENGEQPGLVYIGCCVRGDVSVEEHHFQGDRRSIREQATVSALVFLRKCILEHYEIPRNQG